MNDIGNPLTQSGEHSQSSHVINMEYLSNIMNGRKSVIKDILDQFLLQVPGELTRIDAVVKQGSFHEIKTLAHSMRSSFSVLDIVSLMSLLQEIEYLCIHQENLTRIEHLNISLQEIAAQAVEEVKVVRTSYD